MRKNSFESADLSLRTAEVADVSNSFQGLSVGDDESLTSSIDSEDPEYHDLQERSQIVQRYEKGPEQEVEEWENPDLEIYKLTDRYGFVHKNNQAEIEKYLLERKRIEKEASREQKWLKMMNKSSERKKFHRRVWKGVPEKLRSIVWARLLNIDQFKRNSEVENVYKELLMRARLISRDIKQIDLDINRTYRDHLAFRRRYDIKQQSLFNVLCAYALYNTEVGYCQGMSQIAALFLMYMDEEDAFWCLHALFINEKHSMHGFFIPGFPKLVRFQAMYEKIMQNYLPRLRKHLDKAGIPPIYLTKWWFGCFLDRVPFPLALRLWDVFLLEGDAILLAMAYNIMKMHEKSFRKLQMENFMEFIQVIIAQDFGFSDEETLRSLQDCLRKLQSDGVFTSMEVDSNEKPLKPFGPALSRSMIDIRLDIAEIQSRRSRANSLASRSPMVSRMKQNPFPTLPSSQMKEKFQDSRKGSPNDSNSYSGSTITDYAVNAANNISTRYKTENVSTMPAIGEGSSRNNFRPTSRKDDERFLETNKHPFESDDPLNEFGIVDSEKKIFSDKYDSSFSSDTPTSSVNMTRYENSSSTHQMPQQFFSRNFPISSRSIIERPERLNIPMHKHQGQAKLAISEFINVNNESEVDADVKQRFAKESRENSYLEQRLAASYPSQAVRYSNSSISNRSAALEHSNRLPPRAKSSSSSYQKTFSQVVDYPKEKKIASYSNNEPSLSGSGQFLYGSKVENLSMERRFPQRNKSPTLFETKREKVITEVEARVIQLPNNITYVNVGDAESSKKILSISRRRPNESQQTRGLEFGSTSGEYPQQGPFQSQFRENFTRTDKYIPSQRKYDSEHQVSPKAFAHMSRSHDSRSYRF